jgi:hypothetical protein
MPLPISYPFINGHRYSFVSIEAIINNIPYIGFTAINYKPSLKAGMVYGSRPQPIGRTRGKAEFTFDFEMYRQEFELFKASLISFAGPGVGYGEVAFGVVVQYSEKFLPVVTDTIVAARIEEVDLSNADGTDPSKAKCTCSCLDILLNGVPIAIPGGLPFGL